MKTLIVKSTVHGQTATTTLGDPRAKLGNNKDSSLQIRQINNIPGDVSNDQVLTAFRNTIEATAYGKNGQRLEFDYDELGAGKIIK